MVRDQVGVIFHWIQNRLGRQRERKYHNKHIPSCGCNNIVSSSNTNIKELESFFCQFWPNLCEKSAICDLNQNYSLPHLPQDLPPLDPHLSQDQEHNSLSIASSSLMLIIPDERQETSRSRLSRTMYSTMTPLKSPGLVLSLMRRGLDRESSDRGKCDDDLYMDMSSIPRKKKVKKASLPKRRYSRLNSNAKTRLVRKISNYDQKFYKIEPGVKACQNSKCELQVTVNGRHICGDLILKNL